VEHNNHTTDSQVDKGPQRALEIIRERLFDGWPKHCRIIEGRIRQPRGHKRNAANSRIVRIPYPDTYTEQHRSGALYIIHLLLDIKSPPDRTAKVWHAHTELWHGAAKHIGVRQGEKPTDELIVVSGGMVERVLPEVVTALDTGEVYIPDVKQPNFRDVRYCTACAQRMDIRKYDLARVIDAFGGACIECIIRSANHHSGERLILDWLRALPATVEDGPTA
jgi:hypothetical protein